ncbi:MAG: TIGR02099 family protein, partial [Giesbergeria sp.]|nr:TIGR02099 family protein [Giesbergeria sp.]
MARWSLVLMLVVLLTLAAAWGTLHGWIVPRIGDYRIQLQEQAGRALGVPVRIGTLSARSDGLIPALELGDVALLDAQGRAALSLPRVVVALSPRSLWRFGFEQLYIERPELDIRRSAEGRIFIAGLLFSDSDSGDTSAADWLFDQTEVVVRGGTLRWSDELRGAPPLALGDVDVLLRNGNWRHQLRIDATPPPAWGERFTLMGKLREPLLSAHSGNWQQWTGQLFADFQRVDASQLRHYLPADAGVAVAQGYGTVRAWVDVARGAMVGGSADLALSQVSATLGKQLQPLELASIQGRLSGKRQTSGFE